MKHNTRRSHKSRSQKQRRSHQHKRRSHQHKRRSQQHKRSQKQKRSNSGSSKRSGSTKSSGSKKRKHNEYFQKMLHAKKNNLSSFQYNGNQYVGKQHKHLGMVYSKN